MSHDIFISYSHKDKVLADGVCSKLEDQRIRCWMAPRDVPAGVNFAESIIEAIDSCKMFVLIWSANTNASEHILNELNQAFDQGITVIPFRVENVEPSKALKYYIGRTHWLDAMTPPMEKHIKSLANIILTNLGRQAEIKPEIPIVKEKEVIEEKKKEKDEGIKPASKPSAKPRAWWPTLAGLLGVAVVVGLALTLFKQPAQPSSNPLTNSPMVVVPSSQPTNIPMETEIAKPPSTPLPTEKAGYQTQDLGSPYYSTGFTPITFSQNKDWPVRDSDGERLYRGEDDTYQFEIQPPRVESTALYLNGQKNFINSIIEVDAKFGEDNEEVGIICRADYAQSHGFGLKGYTAIFSQNGRVTINRLITVDGPIKEIGIYYRLRFDCIGQKLTVYENGVKILETQDNASYVGGLGLRAMRSDKPVHVAFDNFKLWLPK